MWYTITLTVGLILLVISLFLLRDSLAFLKDSERAVATVIQLDRVSGSDGDTYKPVFTFKTVSGQEITYRHGVSSSPPSWSVGEETVIAYKAGDPSVARLVTYFGTFGWSIVLMAIAMPAIVVGGGYYLAQGVLK
ncbi:MAG: DUF3592 domain-containing protein [Chitinophagaceae bacterium]|nr:DUF3592 domain-containing protein [Chitinophagaceae bacterium]